MPVHVLPPPMAFCSFSAAWESSVQAGLEPRSGRITPLLQAPALSPPGPPSLHPHNGPGGSSASSTALPQKPNVCPTFLSQLNLSSLGVARLPNKHTRHPFKFEFQINHESFFSKASSIRCYKIWFIGYLKFRRFSILSGNSI